MQNNGDLGKFFQSVLLPVYLIYYGIASSNKMGDLQRFALVGSGIALFLLNRDKQQEKNFSIEKRDDKIILRIPRLP